MAPSTLHGPGRRRRATLAWTHELRLALYLMHTEFHLDQGTITTIFQRLFATHITQCGLQELPAYSLRGQFAEANKASRAHLWSPVKSPASTEQEKTLRNRVRDMISNALLAVNNRSSTNETAQYGTDSDEIVLATPQSQPTRRVRRTPTVVIPRSEWKDAVTPQRSLPSAPETPKVPFARRYKGPVWLSPKALAKVPASYEAPCEAERHPDPFPALFWRFWDQSQTYCFNSADAGFVAGKYKDSNIMPTKPNWDIADVFHHIEQTKYETNIKDKFGKFIEVPVPSPFISISSNLVWTLRRAISKRKAEGKNMMVTTFCGQRINRANAEYAKPYVDRIKLNKAFTGGKQRYSGAHEWLIWAEIPSSAAIKTFPLADFLAFVNGAPTISRLIQLPVLSTGSNAFVYERLQAGNVRLDAHVAASIGALARYAGLSEPKSAEYIVSECVAGFAPIVEYRNPESWAQLSSAFALSFCFGGVGSLNSDAIRMAFIIGCSLGLRHPTLDTNLAARGTDKVTGRLQSRILSVGLNNPVQIMADALDRELNDAKQRLALQYETFKRRFQPSHRQLLLQDEMDVSAETDDDDEEMTSFDFDDFGRVV